MKDFMKQQDEKNYIERNNRKIWNSSLLPLSSSSLSSYQCNDRKIWKILWNSKMRRIILNAIIERYEILRLLPLSSSSSLSSYQCNDRKIWKILWNSKMRRIILNAIIERYEILLFFLFHHHHYHHINAIIERYERFYETARWEELYWTQ